MTFHGSRVAIGTAGSFSWVARTTVSLGEGLAFRREGRLTDLDSELVPSATLVEVPSCGADSVMCRSERPSGAGVREWKEASEGTLGAAGDMAAHNGPEPLVARVRGLACPNTTRGDWRQKVSEPFLKVVPRFVAFKERINRFGDELR